MSKLTKMGRRVSQRMVIMFLLAFIAAMFAFGWYNEDSWNQGYRWVNSCHEDEVLVGKGNFYSDGRSDWYDCGPAVDDL